MAIYTRIAAAIAAGMIFAGCTTIADDTKAKPDRHAAAAENPSCLAETGSRISVKGKCRGTGRSYTDDDIRDPSITVHH